MKKIRFLSIGALLLVSLAACANKGGASGGGSGGGGGGGGGGTVVSFTYSDFAVVSEQSYTLTKQGVTVSCTKGTINTKNTFFSVFKDQSFTVSASSLSKIEITASDFVSDKGAKYDAEGLGDLAGLTKNGTSATWTGSSESVTFTASNYQVRFITISVTL